MQAAPSVNGSTRLMGIIGEGISYTLSPVIHNRAAALLGINIIYIPISIPASKLASFLEIAWDMGAAGFNVTTPHKMTAARLTGNSGSVNTLVRGDMGWKGLSTDGRGFANGLGRLGKKLEDFSHITIMGTGGVVRALLEFILGSPAVVSIDVLGRSGPGSLFDGLEALKERCTFRDLNPDNLAAVLNGRGAESLLVQATSAPHQGDNLSAYVTALTNFNGCVSDLVYGRPSQLYFAAMARDLLAQDGEAMLIEQARLAQQAWWGKAAAYEDLAAAIRSLEKLRAGR